MAVERIVFIRVNFVNHPSILVLGYSEASMLLRKPGDVRVAAAIAIHGQRDCPLDVTTIPASLVLQFDDTQAPDAGDPMQAARIRIRQRDAAEYGLRFTPPTMDDAKSIIAFAQSIQNLDGVLLCQCHAGVSRSAAAALLCLATWTQAGDEVGCLQYLRSIRPCAFPHRDLVRFGDEILERGGRLLTSLDEHCGP